MRLRLAVLVVGVTFAGCQSVVPPLPSPAGPPLPWHPASAPLGPQSWFLGEESGLIWALDVVGSGLLFYDVAADAWADRGTQETAASAAAVYGGKLFLFGLGVGQQIDVMAVDLETLERRGINPRGGAGMTAVAGNDGLIYVLLTPRDGQPDQGPQELHIFDIATEAWRTAPAMPGPRIAAALAAAPDSGVYVVAGEIAPTCDSTCNAQRVRDIVRYEPAADSWAELSDLPGEACAACPPYAYATFAADGLLYVATGVEAPPPLAGELPENVNGRVDVYDPMADAWGVATTLPGSLIPEAINATDDGWVVVFGLSRGERYLSGWNDVAGWRMRVAVPETR